MEVMIESGVGISGTMAVPDGAKNLYPAVLIISKSGKGDRNGNLKEMEMNINKDLAEFLTGQGFVTLRYDKRGINKSGGSFLAAGISDFIEDAASALRFLKNHPQVDAENIVILGHSEGALMAPASSKIRGAAHDAWVDQGA